MHNLLVRVLATVFLSLALASGVLAAGPAARVSETIIRVDLQHLDCDAHAEPDCLNVAASLAWDVDKATGTLCIDIADYHLAHPAIGRGCAVIDAGNIEWTRTAISVAPTEVTAALSEDCFMTDPEEHCVPRTVTMQVGLTAEIRGPSAKRTSIERNTTGTCRTMVRRILEASDASVGLVVDGFVYAFPSGAPHTAFSRFTRERVNAVTIC